MVTTNTDLEIHVESVMQRHPITVRDDDTVQDAVDKMIENHLSALLVVDENHVLQGILTTSDLLRVVQDTERTLDSNFAEYDSGYLMIDLIRDTIGKDEIINVMALATFTAKQGDSLHHVAKLMLDHQVHHIPVVSKDKRLLGVVSAIDFVRLAADSV